MFVLLLAMPLIWLVQHGMFGGIPLGLAAVMMILSRDLHVYPSGCVGRDYGVLAVSVASVGVYLVSRWGGSTALQMIALGLFSVAWLSRIFPARRMGGIVCLVGLICLPVAFLRGNLLLWLQRMAAEIASWLLDFCAVAHVRQGVVLESAKGFLFVEEACSGMQSLLTGLVVAQVYFCWHRKGLLFSLAGLACCSGFLLLGNSLRIFLVAWLYVDHGIDWTKGWLHEMSGLLVYLLVLGFLPSLGHLLEWAGSRFSFWHSPWLEHQGHSETRSWEAGTAELKPFAALSILVALLSMPLRTALAVMVLAWGGEMLLFRPPETAAGSMNVSGLPRLEEIELPAELAGWRQDPVASEVSVIEKFALNQRVWTFRKGGLKAWVAAGLPYDHLHPLRLCYMNRDWMIKDEGTTAIAKSARFSYLELLPKENVRQPMLVCFDNYDLAIQRYAGGPPDRIASRWSMLVSRLKWEDSNPAASSGPFCQIQVVQPGVTDLHSSEGIQSTELFSAAREYFAGKLAFTRDP